MKNLKGIVLSIIIIIIVIATIFFSINYVKSDSENSKTLEQKVNSEMKYLDNKILGILNGLNNIVLRNYAVSSYEVETDEKEVNKQETDNKNEESSNSSDINNNESKSNLYEIKATGILLSNKDINWENIKSEIEIIYGSWNTIILDLYKLNVSSENILKFSSNLDEATKAIKTENKKDSLYLMSELYSLIAVYMENYQGNTKETNIQKVKAAVMRAYANVENENWAQINTEIANADNIYLTLLNGNSKEDNYDINKGYILLKELQNSISQKDQDIFYIKYKNLIEKLNNI